MLKRNFAAERSERQDHDLADPPPLLREALGKLVSVARFGSNPGGLRMHFLPPQQRTAAAALVIALHGEGQNAAEFAAGTGWADLAEHHGFALLLPEQSSVNNANHSFNWYEPADSRRERGEAKSIRQMIDAVMALSRIDPQRIFINGFAAGGGMASVMLACYPELFNAGAIIAGLPHGAATNADQAREYASRPRVRPAREWGYLVRSASTHKEPWPRISVWHGSADATVHPANSGEILKQWTELHGLPLYPSEARIAEGHEHRVWREAGGKVLVEQHLLTGMGHGIPVTGDTEKRGGPTGRAIRASISATEEILRFWDVGAA